MNKIIFLILCFVIPNKILIAQIKAQGIYAGTAICYQVSKSGGSSSTNDTRLGILIGTFIELPLSSDFHFQPAVQFTSKGGIQYSTTTSRKVIKLNYIELPLIINYRPFRLDGRIIFGIGPSVSYGISAKEISKPNRRIENLQFGNELGSLKPLEYSLNGSVGIQLTNKIAFVFNMNKGISSIYNISSSDYGLRNTYFGAKFLFRDLR